MSKEVEYNTVLFKLYRSYRGRGWTESLQLAAALQPPFPRDCVAAFPLVLTLKGLMDCDLTV